MWTATVVRHWICTRFGLEYCRERGRQLRHTLGGRRRRRRHRHLKAKAEEQAAFRDELGALLGAWPEEWELSFVDEATPRRHPTLTAQGCLVDGVPEVPPGDDQTTVQGYGAVAPLPGRTPCHVSPAWGKAACAKCLQHLMAYDPGKRVLAVHDRGAHRHGAAIEEGGREAGGRRVLNPQPAYSPELNPPERLRTWWRRGVPHTHWLAPLREPIDALRNVFRDRAGVKAQVRRLCGLKPPESFVASL